MSLIEQSRRLGVQNAAMRGESIQKRAIVDREGWWLWMDPEKNADIDWNWAAFDYRVADPDEDTPKRKPRECWIKWSDVMAAKAYIDVTAPPCGAEAAIGYGFVHLREVLPKHVDIGISEHKRVFVPRRWHVWDDGSGGISSKQPDVFDSRIITVVEEIP